MQKFVPKDKLSKKAKRELDNASRGSWQGVNPVTRKEESKKVYNRKKVQRGDYNDPQPVEPLNFTLQCHKKRIELAKLLSCT